MPKYGQLVIGAPGAGKTTYCAGLLQLFQHQDSPLKRRCVSVNLDPANEQLPFPVDVDIRDLVTVEDVMEKLALGPNGALQYCMRMLADNTEWLIQRLEKFGDDPYLLIDMPGQLELYAFDDTIRRVVKALVKGANCRLCAVHLSDSLYASDPGKFISVALSALSVMVNLEMPQVNVLSKVDLLPRDIPFGLEFFELLPDLGHLVDLLDDHPVLGRYKKLTKELAGVIQDYSLVSFVSLDVQNKERMLRLLKMADVANGFEFYNIDDQIRGAVMREQT